MSGTLTIRLGKLEKHFAVHEGLKEDMNIYLVGPDGSICEHLCTIRANKQTWGTSE
jgi:hypothetical protein